MSLLDEVDFSSNAMKMLTLPPTEAVHATLVLHSVSWSPRICNCPGRSAGGYILSHSFNLCICVFVYLCIWVFVNVLADQLKDTFCHTHFTCVFVCICVFEYLLISRQISWRIHFVSFVRKRVLEKKEKMLSH